MINPNNNESQLKDPYLLIYNIVKWSTECEIILFQDVPLFEGIINDLFPGVVLPTPDYEVFLEALNENIKKLGLQPAPWFIDKIIQVSVREYLRLSYQHFHRNFHCISFTNSSTVPMGGEVHNHQIISCF